MTENNQLAFRPPFMRSPKNEISAQNTDDDWESSTAKVQF